MNKMTTTFQLACLTTKQIHSLIFYLNTQRENALPTKCNELSFEASPMVEKSCVFGSWPLVLGISIE